jgi:hypothetical protein
LRSKNVFSILSEVALDVIRCKTSEVFNAGNEKRYVVAVGVVAPRIPERAL